MDVAFELYRTHVSCKPDRCVLSELDLLYASNFKGGNSSICEALPSIRARLPAYSKVLKALDKKFGKLRLGELKKSQVHELIKLARSFLELTEPRNSPISGFKAAYASAVLCAHFPELLPVIDKWVLNGAGIVAAVKKVPIENIEQHYGVLVEKSWKYLRTHPDRTLRQLDREWYTK